MIDRRTKVEQPRSQRKRRGTWARVVIALLVLVLGYTLYHVQVASAARYALMAKENRMRPITVRAPRGTIYDRHGDVVAENVVGYRVLLMPAPIDSLRAEIARLQPLLAMSDDEVEAAFRRYRRAPAFPMEVLSDAAPGVVARIEERRYLYPSVLIHEYPKRHYPAGSAIAHLIGYVSEISEAELKRPDFAGYQQGRWIGKAGLERQYERVLGGEPGVRYLEVDAAGRIKRWLPEEMGEPPIPGHDLQLYLDLDLQKYIAAIFPRNLNGGMVALDPKTGGILAYYSHPSYDPNQFVGGISATLWKQLNTDPNKPLLDRVGGSAQPPASTWKLAVAAMALDLGVLDPEAHMPVPCTGGMSYGGRYARCWGVHGYQDLVGGIKNSCDVYFYQVGIKIGLERYIKTGLRFGFTQRTGIDLPNEIANTFPDGLDFWRRRFGYTPAENEIMALSIGQGPQTMTLLRMAEIYAAISRPDGRVPSPRLAMGRPPADTFHINLDARDVWYLEAGMRRVLSPGGTAYLSRLPDWDIMGKTGTAQAPSGPDHAWFVGLGGPTGRPVDIVVAGFLEHGQHGTEASGPVAEAINFYLDRKYGHPFQMYATPRLRGEHGLPVDWSKLGRPVVDPPKPPAPAPH